MKKLLVLLGFGLFPFWVSAQGLENIIVEKYYISDARDETASDRLLPAGSVTYRIFVDMLPYYRFQAAFGIPGHELRLSTTTSFYNHPGWGAIIPNVIPYRNLVENTVMLDSWLSVGSAGENSFGVLKSDDNGQETIVNANSVLQNDDSRAGIALLKQDGLLSGNPARVTIFGIDSLTNSLFGKGNNSNQGAVFSTSNGSWASLYGSVGADSITHNKLLIAQVTTNGTFSFELNIQLGSPTGGTEQYVARNPSGDQKLVPSLIFKSKPLKPLRKSKAKDKAN